MKALIIGSGVGGRGIAELLDRLGRPYEIVTDAEPPNKGFDWGAISEVILSGGIEMQSPWLLAARSAQVHIVGEAQFALETIEKEKSARLVAVTGTNGKTTLVNFAAHVLKCLGIDAQICGNCGFSLGSFAAKPHAVGVVELSSFQLARMEGPFFESGVILEMTTDHLDWHGTMERYVEAKARLGLCLKEGAELWVAPKTLDAYRSSFLPPARALEGAGLIDAALALLEPFDVTREAALDALNTFEGLPHRLEEVESPLEMRIINDSKATNFAALKFAMDQLKSERVTLILSGIPKENSPQLLSEITAGAESIVVFGAMERIAPKRAIYASSLASAVETAFELCTQSGSDPGVVLFSPGGSSFDCFENYVDRGEQFKYTAKKSAEHLLQEVAREPLGE